MSVATTKPVWFRPKAVADYFLLRAEADGERLDQMKLQRLVYFAHGWHLAIRGRPLLDEQIEAQEYGPVIRSLRRAFRDYGNDPIDPPISEEPPTPKFPEETLVVLDRVWDVFGKFTGVQLSKMAHAEGTPWSRVEAAHNGALPRGTDVPQEWIKDYFVELGLNGGPKS